MCTKPARSASRESRRRVQRMAFDVSLRRVLKNPSIEPVLRSLVAVRKRLLAQAFLDRLASSALALAAVLVMVGAWRRWALLREPWDGVLGLAAAAAAAGIALIWTASRVPRLERVAQWLDRAGTTRDRFLTALTFSKTEPSGMRAMAVRECTEFAGRRSDFRSLARLRSPRQLGFLVVPLVALALMQWEARMTFRRLRADAATARAAVEDPARQLEQLARKIEQAEDSKSEDLQKIAEQLRQRAERLRAEARNPGDAQKAALREVSELEQLVREMQKQPAASQEMQELAKALEQNEKTRPAAEALKSGDLAKAAEALEKSLRDLAAAKDERTPEEVKHALEQALKHHAAQQKLSQQMEQLAQQMEQSGAGGKAMQHLAQILRQMGKSQQSQPGQGGRPLTEQEAKNLLAALQNMKYGEGQDAPQGQPGNGDGKATAQSFGDPKSDAPPGNPQSSSGHPGSERDMGTTATPFGDERNPAGKDAKSRQLAGRLGEGETLQQFLPSTGDASKSNRRYKELYQAMAPAAEDAVLQENIPLGSRFFIKRYFESIRPVE